jgi:hypothetical protein
MFSVRPFLMCKYLDTYYLSCLDPRVPRLIWRPVNHLSAWAETEADSVNVERLPRVCLTAGFWGLWRQAEDVLDVVPPVVHLPKVGLENKVEVDKWANVLNISKIIDLVDVDDSGYGDTPRYALVVLGVPEWQI